MTTDNGAEASGSPTVPSMGHAAFWLTACLLAALHGALLNHFMPARAVFSAKPLSGMSYDRHAGEAFRVTHALSSWHETWVYDAQRDAGSAAGTLDDLDGKGWELWVFALSRLGVPLPLAFNSFAWLWMLLAPWLIYAAARGCGMSAPASLLAAGFTSALWFFDSYLHWAWFVGMVAWCGAACLSLLAFGLFQRWSRTRRRRDALLAIVVVGVTSLVHAAALLTLLVPLGVSFARAYRTLSIRERLVPVAMLAFASSVNAGWLVAAIEHRMYLAAEQLPRVVGAHALLCDVLEIRCAGSSTGSIGTRVALRLFILALAVAGLYVQRSERKPAWLALACAIAACYALTYFGGYVPWLRRTQPYQQLIPAMLFCTLPAAEFLTNLLSTSATRLASRAGGGLAIVLVLLLGRQIAAGQVLYFAPQWVPEPKIFPDGARSPLSKFGWWWTLDLPSALLFRVPHGKFMDAGADEIIAWLARNARAGARILVDDGTLAERLALRTELEVLGGSQARGLAYTDPHSVLRDRQLESGVLAQYLQTYGVEWVVSGRPELRKLARVLDFKRKFTRRSVYETVAPVGRVLAGGGTALAQTNQIDVRGSVPDRQLILAYHWHPALRCRPACRVAKHAVGVDPIGFIAVAAPHPSDLVIWNSYEH